MSLKYTTDTFSSAFSTEKLLRKFGFIQLQVIVWLNSNFVSFVLIL